jgi:hypothetical protein
MFEESCAISALVTYWCRVKSVERSHIIFNKHSFVKFLFDEKSAAFLQRRKALIYIGE